MGKRNFLIEGPSGAGKTTVCDALLQRGYQAVHGDRVLAYQGDPLTGLPLDPALRDRHRGDIDILHGFHIWDVDKVRALAADPGPEMTFFCGGSRNHGHFLDLFERVFFLEVDINTLIARIERRPPDEFGGRPEERRLVARVVATREDMPKGATHIDGTAPIDRVVDEILSYCR